MNSIILLLQFIDDENLWEKPEIYRRNEVLKDADCPIFFIEKGGVKITTIIENEEQIIRLGYRNSLITNLDKFLGKERSAMKITAIKETSAKAVSKKTLVENIITKCKTDLWVGVLEELILQQSEREIDLLNPSAKIRYERVLKRSPQLFQEIPNKYIASYLRMSSETLSRLLKS